MAFAAAGTFYGAAAAFAVARILRMQFSPPSARFPAITILKPLHGAEPELENSLASFLAQDYPMPVQVVFGVRDPADPALAVVRNLKTRFSSSDIGIMADRSLHGTNPKISSLINMMKIAKHDFIVLADSDITVPSNYLTLIAAAGLQEGVGAVSSLYFGKGTTNVWSKIVAMGTSYQFLPSAAFGIFSGLVKPCFGSTIALTRDMLTKIGGFEAFANDFADDYEIGRAVVNAGYEISYPAVAVQHGNTETTFSEAINHELRWARTIRVLNPMGHLGSIITYPVALALAGAILAGFSYAATLALAVAIAMRLASKLWVDSLVGISTGALWLLPARDLLSFVIFVGSFFGSTVEWRGERLRINRTGAILEV